MAFGNIIIWLDTEGIDKNIAKTRKFFPRWQTCVPTSQKWYMV